jgi:putative transposase
MPNPRPERKRPCQTVYTTPDAPTIVFLTICTQNRTPWLTNPKAHTLLAQTWQTSTAWLVGSYVLMPDHIHLFCSPQSSTTPLTTWTRYWKRAFSLAANEPTWLWQSNQWHRRMRNQQNYRDQVNYMLQNPFRAGLIATPNSWPYSGTIHPLSW